MFAYNFPPSAHTASVSWDFQMEIDRTFIPFALAIMQVFAKFAIFPTKFFMTSF
jgi:hypothetical protein